MGKRRRARELVLQGLYAWEVSNNSVETILEDFRKIQENDDEVMAFTIGLLTKATQNREALDEAVSQVVTNWQFERIALLDRLVLRMALCELMNYEEIPPKVTINEAIDLAKKFSTYESGRFVNGVLDALYKKLKEDKRITKSGRGLID